jgi:V8-like Glu-specific endopeptidase
MNKYVRISRHLQNGSPLSQVTKVCIVLSIFLGMIVCTGFASAITNGTLVKQGEFDAIGIVGNSSDCTGTLIQGNLVLTSAHCFEDCSCCRAKFSIYEKNLENESNESQGYSFYGDVIINPNYKIDSEDDIALIKLDKNISQILHIRPIPIANYLVPAGTSLMIVGFGNISTNCEVLNLRNKYKSNASVYYVTGHTRSFRASPEITGICPGDSGGPALDNATQIVAVIRGQVRSDNSIVERVLKLARISDYDYNWIQGVIRNTTSQPEAFNTSSLRKASVLNHTNFKQELAGFLLPLFKGRLGLIYYSKIFSPYVKN